MSAPPGERDLRIFGAVLPLACAGAGWLGMRIAGPRAALWIWAVGGGVTLAYWSCRALRQPVHGAWTGAAELVGRGVTQVLLASVYFLVVTPLGLLLRALRRDPLARRFERERRTYWTPHDPGGDARRYLRQS